MVSIREAHAFSTRKNATQTAAKADGKTNPFVGKPQIVLRSRILEIRRMR